MGFTDLLDWMDNTNPLWRDGEFIRVEMDLMEEMLFRFLSDNEDWLDDIVPPCIAGDRLEWVCALFVSEGPAVKETIWSIFGYCQKEMVNYFVGREALGLAYE